MFCSKCGAQISGSDQFCPKCGKENINYTAPNKDEVQSTIQFDASKWQKNDLGEKHTPEKIKWILPIFIVGALAIIGVLALIILGKGGTGIIPSAKSRVSYSPRGISGYIDKDGGIHFVDAGEVISVEGRFLNGRSTPDHSKYLTMSVDGTLQFHEMSEGVLITTTISEKVETILTTNNDGCFYTSGTKSHLYYYEFAGKRNVDTSLEDCSYTYSRNRNTVIGISELGEMSIFTKGDSSAKVLCNADDDAEICCIADNGSNVVWTVKDGNTFGIYMLKNGAPERIGKITNTEEYSYVYGLFYNDDKSFIVYSNGSSQMIWGQNEEIKELALPGVKEICNFYDQNGQYIDSDDDYIAEPYFIIRKTKNSDSGGIYRLTKEGSIVLEADDIKLESDRYYLEPTYYIRNGNVYFINKDGDMYKKQLGEGNEVVLITTDVKKFFIPEQGKYAYVVKSGSLYYVELSDKDYKLNLVWNKLSDDDTIALTDKPDVLYFISNVQDITDTYRTKGKVYQFIVGSEAKEIAQNIMYIQSGDKKNVRADYPIFEQYVSHKWYDFIINVGTCSDGGYKELIKSVKD